MTNREQDPASPKKAITSLDRLYHSPPLLLSAIVVAVFLSEYLVMSVLASLKMLHHPIHQLLDALLLVTLLLPILILLVFRPVKQQLAERQLAENELAEERNKLKEILDAMPAGVCIVSRDHRIEYANSALVKEFGPVDGRMCFDYFHARPEVCPDCRFDHAPSGKTSPWEWHAEKTGKIYEVFETPLRNANGVSTRLAMVRDITARKLAADELKASRERLRSLSDHLQRAREEERAAVSREIHDELGQVLATVQLEVSSLAEAYRDHRHLIDKIAGVERLIAGAIKTVQSLSARLRPALLDELGLAEALEWQIKEFQTRTGIPCTHDILLQDTRFGKEVATAIFRTCQEALTNVMRHAEATRVAVSLEERKGRIVLIVRDNGRGITSEQVRDRRSLGIIGMRERAYMLGGRVRICRRPEGGTLVLAHIPANGTGETR